MKKIGFPLFTFFLFIQSYTVEAQLNFDETKWKKIYTKNDVVVTAQPIEGSKLLAFRASYDMKANISDIVYNLREVDSSANWLPSVLKKFTLKDISDTKAITYSINNIPWPVSDRDMVLMNDLKIEKEKKRFTVFFYSVKDPHHPVPEGVVRAEVPHGSLACKYLGKNKTNVEVTLFVDPKGKVPSWIVNIVQRKLPYDFMKAVEKRAQLVTGKNRKGMAEMLEKYYQLMGVKVR